MLSKKYAMALAFGILFTSMASFLLGAANSNSPKHDYNDNPKYNFPNKWDEIDTTDIFAIPFDESGEEQEEELDTLEEGYPPKK